MHMDGCSLRFSLARVATKPQKALWPARQVVKLDGVSYLGIPCKPLPLTKLDLLSRGVGPSHHMQMSKPGEEEGLQTLLDSITAQTRPDAQHAAYHAKHLEQLMHKMESQRARCVV